MPAWGYFFQEVYRDKTLNVDPQAKFIVPADMQNEVIYDYQELSAGEAPPPAEGENVGAGSSSDFIEVPISDGSEAISAESKQLIEDEVPQPLPKKEPTKSSGSKTAPPSNADSTRKKRNFLQKVFGKKNGQ
jgi:hypothetical protein